MSAESTLGAWGIVRPADVVAIAAGASLKLEYAAVMLQKESYGGRNVWGSDRVPTGGAYGYGDEVTQQNYAAYLDAVHEHRAGRQGVGPAQLTYYALQDQADNLGGAWRWEVNLKVGCLHLAGLIRQYGEREGFRRYNGAGAAAEVYAADAMVKLADWRLRLGTSAPAGASSGSLTYGMKGDPQVRSVQAFLARVFPAYAAGLPATGSYLDQTVEAVLEFQKRAGVRNGDGSAPDGRTVGPNTWAALYAHGYPRKAA